MTPELGWACLADETFPTRIVHQVLRDASSSETASHAEYTFRLIPRGRSFIFETRNDLDIIEDVI